MGNAIRGISLGQYFLTDCRCTITGLEKNCHHYWLPCKRTLRDARACPRSVSRPDWDLLAGGLWGLERESRKNLRNKNKSWKNDVNMGGGEFFLVSGSVVSFSGPLGWLRPRLIYLLGSLHAQFPNLHRPNGSWRRRGMTLTLFPCVNSENRFFLELCRRRVFCPGPESPLASVAVVRKAKPAARRWGIHYYLHCTQNLRCFFPLVPECLRFIPVGCAKERSMVAPPLGLLHTARLRELNTRHSRALCEGSGTAREEWTSLAHRHWERRFFVFYWGLYWSK